MNGQKRIVDGEKQASVDQRVRNEPAMVTIDVR